MSVSVDWFKSEARDVRPFFELESLEPALSHCSIRIYENMPFTKSDSFVINDQDIARLDIAIRPTIDKSLIQSCPKAIRDKLILAVRTTNPFLKRNEIAKHALNSVPEEIAIGSEVLERLGGGSNLDIDAFICLDGELPKHIGRPFLRGHWLAQKGFKLHPARIIEDFDIEPIEDERWKELGYPAKTLYLVNYIGPMNEKPAGNQQIAKVFVHADVHRRIAAETDSRKVRAIQSILGAEIVCQIIRASMSEWESASEPEPGSPLSAAFKRINKTFKCDLSELRALAAEPGLQKLRAILQADAGTVRAIIEG
jgi:hypothetical protein